MDFAALHITIAETTAVTLPVCQIGGDRQMQRVVEPCEFKVMTGHSPAEIRLSGSFVVME